MPCAGAVVIMTVVIMTAVLVVVVVPRGGGGLGRHKALVLVWRGGAGSWQRRCVAVGQGACICGDCRRVGRCQLRLWNGALYWCRGPLQPWGGVPSSRIEFGGGRGGGRSQGQAPKAKPILSTYRTVQNGLIGQKW